MCPCARCIPVLRRHRRLLLPQRNKVNTRYHPCSFNNVLFFFSEMISEAISFRQHFRLFHARTRVGKHLRKPCAVLLQTKRLTLGWHPRKTPFSALACAKLGVYFCENDDQFDDMSTQMSFGVRLCAESYKAVVDYCDINDSHHWLIWKQQCLTLKLKKKDRSGRSLTLTFC